MKLKRFNPYKAFMALGAIGLAACQHPADLETRLGPSPDVRAVSAASALGVASSPEFEAVRTALGGAVQGFYEPQWIGVGEVQNVDASLLDLTGPKAQRLREALRAEIERSGTAR